MPAPPMTRTPRCARQPSNTDTSGASVRSVSNRTSVLSELPVAPLSCNTFAPSAAYQKVDRAACHTGNGPNSVVA